MSAARLQEARTRERGRFLAVDALRGIAALMVVFYHMRLLLREVSPGAIPKVLEAVLSRGSLGVDVFFVLSGFVIAYSVRDGLHCWSYLGRFALRRAIRLDPPYWCVIALEIALIYLGLWVIPTLGTPLPTWQQVVAHLFYLQNILGYGDILPIFWTLCYEIQFYLLLVVLLVVWRQLKAPPRVRTGLAVMVLMTLFAVSLWTRFNIGAIQLPVSLAVNRWFQFFLGVLVCWRISGVIGIRPLVAAWGVIAMLIVAGLADVEQSLAIVTSMVILATASRPSLDARFGGRVLQYLGRNSYSIYLMHLPIGWRASRALYLVVGEPVLPLLGWGGFAVGVATSIIAADLLHRFLEAPAMRLSKRISLPRRVPGTVA